MINAVNFGNPLDESDYSRNYDWVYWYYPNLMNLSDEVLLSE